MLRKSDTLYSLFFMKRIEAEEIIGELDEILFLIGNRDICYLFHVDKKIKVVKLSINAMDIILKEFSFIRINLSLVSH